MYSAKKNMILSLKMFTKEFVLLNNFYSSFIYFYFWSF